MAATGGGESVEISAEALAGGMLRVAEAVHRCDPWALAESASRHYSYAIIARALIEIYGGLMERQTTP